MTEIMLGKILQTQAENREKDEIRKLESIDHLGAFIRSIRKEKRITLQQLADQAGIGISTLQYLETRSHSTIYTTASVLDALGYEIIIKRK